MRIADLLRSKGTAVATATPETTVTALLAGLAEHNVGAMVVVAEDGSIAGIVSERDVVRRLNDRGPAILDGPVS
ncbi:MAG TPA: CBS domain-containing protein, partial [Amycolatopsis sp.]|nr:CBS domain-containing protein [Amycolatopsis sp.]